MFIASLVHTIVCAGWDAADEAASGRSITLITYAMWGTTVPMGCLGAFASWLRLRYFQVGILAHFG